MVIEHTGPTTVTEAQALILEAIRRDKDLSFAGIMNMGEWTNGDLEWEMPADSNIILWSGISQMLADALTGLREQIVPVPCSLLVYLADGAAVTLPIAKRLPKGGYKTPHWLPVVFVLR